MFFFTFSETLKSLGVAATLDYKAEDYTHKLISHSGKNKIYYSNPHVSVLVLLLNPDHFSKCGSRSRYLEMTKKS